ncbi:MAG: hypothetical protein J7K22_04740 [Nanoarchaeota archaeon]|nr:hypothetical protein [Nanoarchaeota archaeon]
MDKLAVMLKKVSQKRKEKPKDNSYERLKREEFFEFFIKHFKSILSIPILIGVVAAIIMYDEFGWEKLEEVLLSWTIGLTLLATIVALIERYTRFR